MKPIHTAFSRGPARPELRRPSCGNPRQAEIPHRTALHWTVRSFPIFTILFLFAPLFFLSGCKGGGLEGLVPVQGTVTFKDQPLTEATISFSPYPPGDGKRGGAALSDRQGMFSAWTVQPGDGLLPGEYRVSIIKETVNNTMSIDEMNAYAVKHGRFPELEAKRELPTKYADPDKSGLTVNIPEQGIKDIKFELIADKLRKR